jgi:hypothetical protein
MMFPVDGWINDQRQGEPKLVVRVGVAVVVRFMTVVEYS